MPSIEVLRELYCEILAAHGTEDAAPDNGQLDDDAMDPDGPSQPVTLAGAIAYLRSIEQTILGRVTSYSQRVGEFLGPLLRYALDDAIAELEHEGNVHTYEHLLSNGVGCLLESCEAILRP